MGWNAIPFALEDLDSNCRRSESCSRICRLVWGQRTFVSMFGEEEEEAMLTDAASLGGAYAYPSRIKDGGVVGERSPVRSLDFNTS